MPFERPTLSALVKRARTDIETRLPDADANLRGSPEEVLGITAAGMTHGLHGHLVWLSKQILPDVADDEFLVRWAGIWGLERIAATEATGDLTITGTTGTTVPAGTEFERGDGALFTTDADVTMSAGTGVVAVTASDAGADGNTDSGTTLSLTSPIAGINSDATAGTLSGGADRETISALRTRLLTRLATPPTGGGPGDYVSWALEVAGVTRAWEYPLLSGPGTVGVYFVRDNDVSLIPDSGEVATVQAYLESVAPVTAEVTAYAPTAVPLNFTIALDTDTAAIRAAVEAELEDLLLRVAEPGATIYLSQISEAISLAEGETSHTLTAPAANVTHATNEIATMGTVSFT